MSDFKVNVTVVNDREKPFKDKIRKLSKTPTTFHIKLTEQQKAAKAVILENTLTFLTGRAGTAKTTVACQVAVDMLIKGAIDKIIITRPTVLAGKSLGFIPGDITDPQTGKMAPYLDPILDAMKTLRKNETELEKWIKDGKIEVVVPQYCRGRNFKDCFVLIDEGANMTYNELKLLTTRICENSKMVITCDVNQIDLRDKAKSAAFFIDDISHLPEVALFELTENFRHPLALAISAVVDAKLEERSSSTK